MDIKSLLTEAKARFQHNAAKDYLKEKYSDKLLLADQGGLWKADTETIGNLSAYDTETVILIDTFGIPVEVDRVELLNKLKSLNQSVMTDYLTEWKSLEAKR